MYDDYIDVYVRDCIQVLSIEHLVLDLGYVT